jgi:membrane protein
VPADTSEERRGPDDAGGPGPGTGSGTDPEPDTGIGRRFERAVALLRDHAERLGARYPRIVELLRFAFASDTIDRCFAVAAQIFITAVPMAIAISAFLPRAVQDDVRRSFSEQLGVKGQTAQTLVAFLNGQNSLREAVGVAGLIISLISATSLTRRLQRMYERQWSLPPGRMKSSAVRWLAWIVVWAAVLSAQGPIRSGSGARLVGGWIVSGAMSVALWWWTPHLLLLRRVGWRALLPTALLTGLGQTAIGIGSRVVMPTVTGRSVSEYGPFGLVLSLMSWLLVVAGCIVIGAGVGKILAEGAGGEVAAERRGGG